MDLEAVLTDNGLGEWHSILQAERITLDNIGLMTNDDLRELDLPLGARREILVLFAQPQRPGPASSKASSPNKHGGRSLQPSNSPVVKWTKHGSGKKFACFLSHHKASCAMEARFLKDKLQGLIQKECFLDSDDLRVRWRCIRCF
jgi:hypothetical protein